MFTFNSILNKLKYILTTLDYNSAENEIRYIIVTAAERGDRGECRIGFPSLTCQNPEEGGNNLRNVGL